jgi:hypothetical protein
LGFPVWPAEMENFAEITFINRGNKSVSWWERFWSHLLWRLHKTLEMGGLISDLWGPH